MQNAKSSILLIKASAHAPCLMGIIQKDKHNEICWVFMYLWNDAEKILQILILMNAFYVFFTDINRNHWVLQLFICQCNALSLSSVSFKHAQFLFTNIVHLGGSSDVHVES